MKAVVHLLCIFAALGPLSAFDIVIDDPANLYYLKTALRINFTVINASKIAVETAIIDQAKVTNGSEPEVNGTSVKYFFHIMPNTSSFVTSLNLTIEAKESNDKVRRFIQEFEFTAMFNNQTIWANWSGIPHSFVVSPPRFSHFQVKTDWRYNCPVYLSLPFCHVSANKTDECSAEPPYSSTIITLGLNNTVFHGGKPPGHDYTDKTEDCPLAYETKQDIGIACIAAFWTIALAVVLWGVVKFLLKRYRKRYD